MFVATAVTLTVPPRQLRGCAHTTRISCVFPRTAWHGGQDLHTKYQKLTPRRRGLGVTASSRKVLKVQWGERTVTAAVREEHAQEALRKGELVVR